MKKKFSHEVAGKKIAGVVRETSGLKGREYEASVRSTSGIETPPSQIEGRGFTVADAIKSAAIAAGLYWIIAIL